MNDAHPHVALISLARRGGMLHYQAELANAFAARTRASALTPASVDKTYFSPEVEVHTIETGTGMAGTILNTFNPLFYLQLYRALKAIDADVYHVTGVHEWNPILAFMVKRLLHKPLFYTIHDPKHHPGAPLRMRLTDALFRRSPDGFVAHNPYARSQLPRQGIPDERLLTASSGPSYLFKRWAQSNTAPEDLILFFGRIEPYKGVDTLLRAAPAILDALPSWKLLIAGGGVLPRHATDHPHLLIENRFIPEDEVARLMQRAKFVVMPYRSFTYSGVILTAYAFELPIVSTRVGAIPEFIAHDRTGLLVAPNDPQAFAAAVIRLAQDEALRQRLADNIPDFVEERLSWGRLVEESFRFYERLIE
jgi:starch synthase